MFGTLKRWLAPAPVVESVRMIEVADAAPLAGALFQRAFGQAIPTFERHFVLVHEPQPGAHVALGYIHQTPFNGAHLCGGLAVDAWMYRKLPSDAQALVQAHGGMAEWLLRASVAAVQPSEANFAYVGSPKSLIVVERIGYRRVAGHPHLLVLPAPGAAAGRLDALIEQVKAVGPF